MYNNNNISNNSVFSLDSTLLSTIHHKSSIISDENTFTSVMSEFNKNSKYGSYFKSEKENINISNSKNIEDIERKNQLNKSANKIKQLKKVKSQVKENLRRNSIERENSIEKINVLKEYLIKKEKKLEKQLKELKELYIDEKMKSKINIDELALNEELKTKFFIEYDKKSKIINQLFCEFDVHCHIKLIDKCIINKEKEIFLEIQQKQRENLFDIINIENKIIKIKEHISIEENDILSLEMRNNEYEKLLKELCQKNNTLSYLNSIESPEIIKLEETQETLEKSIQDKIKELNNLNKFMSKITKEIELKNEEKIITIKKEKNILDEIQFDLYQYNEILNIFDFEYIICYFDISIENNLKIIINIQDSIIERNISNLNEKSEIAFINKDNIILLMKNKNFISVQNILKMKKQLFYENYKLSFNLQNLFILYSEASSEILIKKTELMNLNIQKYEIILKIDQFKLEEASIININDIELYKEIIIIIQKKLKTSISINNILNKNQNYSLINKYYNELDNKKFYLKDYLYQELKFCELFELNVKTPNLKICKICEIYFSDIRFTINERNRNYWLLFKNEQNSNLFNELPQQKKLKLIENQIILISSQISKLKLTDLRDVAKIEIKKCQFDNLVAENESQLKSIDKYINEIKKNENLEDFNDDDDNNKSEKKNHNHKKINYLQQEIAKISLLPIKMKNIEIQKQANLNNNKFQKNFQEFSVKKMKNKKNLSYFFGNEEKLKQINNINISKQTKKKTKSLHEDFFHKKIVLNDKNSEIEVNKKHDFDIFIDFKKKISQTGIIVYKLQLPNHEKLFSTCNKICQIRTLIFNEKEKKFIIYKEYILGDKIKKAIENIIKINEITNFNYINFKNLMFNCLDKNSGKKYERNIVINSFLKIEMMENQILYLCGINDYETLSFKKFIKCIK